MDKPFYLAAIEADATGLVSAARRGPAAPVPTCPGWTAGHVAAHVGRAYRWIGEMVATRTQQPVPPRPNDHSCDPADPNLTAWFDRSLRSFLQTMTDTDPDEAVWSWSGDNRAGFWLRLMSHETALHRVDAQSAHSCVEPIAEPLARDAVDGALDWFLPDARAGSLYPGKGESYLLRQTDGDGVWLVRFPANEAVVSRQSGPADLELAGIASDILLFLWRRAPADRLQLGGNPSLAERFHDLAPSI